ncbi:MAG: hypothetical protein KA191_00020 [Verrucomicrobia bacterium]|jgi:hypothetical protein|nr:hypothetical protein [Verrucomicrobiota bacterium]MDI9381145.1 hypothetical protein [Verrucomicrobiota bacterium]NMD21508.1 hypothetical protein [Verrucomicrobiota bacterium]HOF46632.1 hypothetical protein [Verrucomicrobiota bacterium]HOR69671.1 hypothetical protein [Verrucomicrobiota bacterium]
MMRTIREEEPPKPSTRLSTLDDAERNAVADRRCARPDRLDRLVRGDLDWIVMKALEKDRTRRYDTAASLVQDVERHLRGKPIAAAAPSVAYRLAKFVRRNRAAVGVLLIIALTLVLATAISLRSAWVARRERVAADAARANAADAQRAEAGQRRIAEATAQESRRRLARLNTAQGVQLMDRGDWLGAALWFTDALRLAGPNIAPEAADRLRLGVILAYTPRLVRMWSHAGPVNQARFSPDEDKPVWHPAHAGRINALAFRFDEKYLATAASDGSVVLWDLERGGLLRSLRPAGELAAGPGREILQVALSPGGQRLLVLAKDGTVAFWSVPAGEAAGQLATPITGSSSAVFSPDGRHVAVLRATSGIGEARVWDVANGQPVTPALPHAGVITSASFGPDGSLLLTASFDGSARVWNLATGVPPIPPLLDLHSPIPTTKDAVGSEDFIHAFLLKQNP